MTEYRVDNVAFPEVAARELLQKIYKGKIQLPVDVWDIAEKLKIKALKGRFKDEKNVSGVLYKKEGDSSFTAVINSEEIEVRQRFTLAHEIGHYIHKYQDLPSEQEVGKVEYCNDLSSRGIDSEENWANRFAAALLMPVDEINKEWASGKLYEEIAQDFNVSRAALGNRLDELGL